MTSHQFASELLAGPDIQIVIPDSSKVPCEGACNDPIAIEVDGEDSDGNPKQMLLITGRIEAGPNVKNQPTASERLDPCDK